MRVLIYPHDLDIGGSQINAIELAARTQERGHKVIIYGRPGSLVRKVADLGLEFVPSPAPGRRPSIRVVRHLVRLIREHKIDIVHGYEWPPALECYLAAAIARTKVRPLATVMSMAVAPFLPRDLDVIVGTEQIADFERHHGRHNVWVIEPPVDLDYNDKAQVSGANFRGYWFSHSTLAVVLVTRLAHELKLEGVLAAIRAVAELSMEHPIELAIVGDGPARDKVAEAVQAGNRAAGRQAVRMVGRLEDPRAAYAAGDVQIAMGGSALRAMAFGQPLIVQGERGFFELVEPTTVQQFEWTGWYGVGAGSDTGVDRLKSILLRLIYDPSHRAKLGTFSRNYVANRFGLDPATDVQIGHYRRLDRIEGVFRCDWFDAGRAFMQLTRYYGQRSLSRLSRSRPADDFNSRPIAASGHPQS